MDPIGAHQQTAITCLMISTVEGGCMSCFNRQCLEDACEEIDAAIFSGDAFMDSDNRKELREYMARWERELKRLDKVDEETLE